MFLDELEDAVGDTLTVSRGAVEVEPVTGAGRDTGALERVGVRLGLLATSMVLSPGGHVSIYL